MAYSKIAALAAVFGLALAGCSGMQGSSVTPGAPAAPAQAEDATSAAPAVEASTPGGAAPKAEQPPTGGQPAAVGQNLPATRPSAATPAGKRQNPANAGAVNAVNALSSPVKTYGDENTNEPGSNPNDTRGLKPSMRPGKGACHRGREFFVPDKAGDANSSETEDFFDTACTQVARDVVRKWTAGSTTGTETVSRVVNEYAQGVATPIAIRTDNTAFSNATFGTYGFPVIASGFQRETSGQLAIGARKNVLFDSENVMAPTTTAVSNYCTDSAGYNALGIPKLGLAFGWQGGAFTGGTRTQNADGSVTWYATHTGQTESAAIGALSITTAATNTACPIATPAYSLQGGSTKGNYSIPISITFFHGVIRNLTVTNASLASGYTMNVTTNSAKWPTNTSFINGTVTDGTTTIAIFNVNAFGNGKLTVAKTGNQFPITDWNVVR